MWPNVARRLVTCTNPKWAFYPFFLTRTSSYPARFKGSKTVKLWKSPLLQKIKQTHLFWRWHTVTTAGPFWPPATLKASPFQNDIPLSFSYPYYALPPAIQLHLPNASFLNPCAAVIRLSCTRLLSRVFSQSHQLSVIFWLAFLCFPLVSVSYWWSWGV
jgi:hypothetical protein